MIGASFGSSLRSVSHGFFCAVSFFRFGCPCPRDPEGTTRPDNSTLHHHVSNTSVPYLRRDDWIYLDPPKGVDNHGSFNVSALRTKRFRLAQGLPTAQGGGEAQHRVLAPSRLSGPQRLWSLGGRSKTRNNACCECCDDAKQRVCRVRVHRCIS